MPNASASAPASPLPIRSQRAPVSAPAGRSTFADQLTYAFDIAFRAPESLSLAQRAAYGLERPRTWHDPGHAARQAQLVEHAPKALNVARRAQLGDCNTPSCNAPTHNAPKCNAPNVARRAQLGDTQLYETARPRRSAMKVDQSIANVAHPYFTFNARAGGAEITFVVANGRTFAGIRSWTR